jgi:hypothetical protein
MVIQSRAGTGKTSKKQKKIQFNNIIIIFFKLHTLSLYSTVKFWMLNTIFFFHHFILKYFNL